MLVGHESVTEAAVIGVPHDVKGECMVAFCVLTTDSDRPHPALAEELTKRRWRGGTRKTAAPDAVHFVAALPRTRNNKVMRRVIRAAYLDQDPGDLTALENPGRSRSFGRERKNVMMPTNMAQAIR